MAEVYKAYHPGLDRYVAIKVLHSFLADEKDFLTRFQREAKIVATFRHPNIVQVYDFDHDEETNSYYMVMEFVDGPTLKTRLREMSEEGHGLPFEDSIRIVLAVANALDYAHQQGMVHRDVKPANVILTQTGQTILSDFGIARMINTSTLTASGAMVGTPAYMAPEQGMGHIGDERADIYSLGAVLYQLVTGHLPFEADTPLGTVLKHINAPLAPPTDLVPDLPPSIEAVIMRALAKDPDKRYQTARELADDLERALAGDTVEPPPSELVSASAIGETLIGLGARDQAEEKGQPPSPAPPSDRATQPIPAYAMISKRAWIAVIAAALILILLGGAVLTGGASNPLRALLFPQAATPTPGVTSTPAASSTPDLAATYDFLSTQVAAGVDAALATRDALAAYEATINAPTPTSPPTSTPSPTPTPDLTATAIAACEFDVEIRDDQAVRPSVLMPGQQVIKRWTIENTGTCAWPEDIQLVFASGDELNVVARPEIEPVSPGEVTEVQIILRAPATFATYTSVWQLEHGEAKQIGEGLQVTFRVGPTPTPRPTATISASPTPAFTPTPIQPLWMSAPGLRWCTSEKTRGRVEWGSGGGPSGGHRYFYTWVSPENELPGPYNEFVGFPHLATYFTTSGELTFPIPDNCCPGDYGRYVSPEGYEIVWRKIWQPSDNCP